MDGKGLRRGSFLGTNVTKNLVNLGKITVDEANGLPQFAPVTVDFSTAQASLCADVAAAKASIYVVWIADDEQLFWNSACGAYVEPNGEAVRVVDVLSVARGGKAGYITPDAINGNPTNLTVGTFLVANTGGEFIVDADPVTNGFAFYLEILALVTEEIGLTYQFRVVEV